MHKTFQRRIRQNTWGNWNGYEGRIKVREFGLDKFAAQDWLIGEPPTLAELANKPFRIDCCRDGTLSIRKHGQKSFNGAALPCYGTDTLEQARALQSMTCRCDYDDKGKAFPEPYRFAWGCIDGELEQMERVRRVLHALETQGAVVARELATRLDRMMRQSGSMPLAEKIAKGLA